MPDLIEPSLPTPGAGRGLSFRPEWLVALAIVVIGSALWWPVGNWYRGHLLTDERRQLADESTIFSERLGFAIERRLALLEGVRAFVLHEPDAHQGNLDHFDDFAGNLLARTSGIRAISLAPGGVLGDIYPRDGNQVALGHDLQHDSRPEIRQSIDAAIASRHTILNGPFPLILGGEGLVARLAVFEGEKFWGLVNLVMDFPTVLREAEFDRIPTTMRLALRNPRGEVVFGTAPVFAGTPVISRLPFEVPGWELGALPAAGWDALIAGRLLLFRLAGMGGVSLLALTAFLALRYQSSLTREVRLRTASLAGELAARRVSEASLAESHRSLQAFLDAIPETALLMDRGGGILAANRTFRERFGPGSDAVINANYFALLPPELAVDRKLMVDEVLRSGQAVRFEDQRGKRLLANHIHPVLDAGGAVAQMAVLSLDITERRQLEGQLRHTQKLDAIGTLAAGVSHEFNNILTAIIGQASLLEMKLPPDSPLLVHAEMILKSADRAAKLTTALRAFSRQQVTAPVCIDLNELSRHLDVAFGALLGSKTRLVFELSEGPLLVQVDTGLVQQALLSLAANARDAMPQGGTLTITTRRISLDDQFTESHGGGAPGYYALLEVTDTGTGIAPDHLARIFEPFFSTKEVGTGTGLGLSNALGIIRQQHGFLTCSSAPGVGTTFNILLPLVAGDLRPHSGRT